MSKTRKVRGVGWDVSAIGNGLFCPYPTYYDFFILIFHVCEHV